MKLCKLKLKNLNSFRKEVEIDFEKSPLDDASLVAITGPTGAGKTTLLDAICVALYGKTPRLSGRENQHPRHLISHGEEEGAAEVYFEANDARYHATWTIKRKGSPKGQLFDGSGKLITIKVAQEVESILGFDFDTFKRSIMLAQGEFAAFLKADLKDRREILEKTAGIGIYKKLNDKLNQKESEILEAYNRLNLQFDIMPAASYNQLAQAQEELDKLGERTEDLDKKNQNIQKKKESETKRRQDFDELEFLKGRQDEILDQQSEIDVLQAELENAQRAERLRPEKQTYDTAKSDLENAENALNTAKSEKTDAEKQVKTDQTGFDEKERTYQTALTEHEERKVLYTNAKLDIQRAADQFAEADDRIPKMTSLNNQVKTLSDELTSKETDQIDLQKQISKAHTFLHDNPLPSDRQHRLNRATVLLAQLDSQQKQLDTALTSEVEHSKKVSFLEREIEKLSKTHAERLSEKIEAEAILKDADAELNKLQSVGTQDEWNARKQQAVKAQPIVQKYETAENDLTSSKDRLCKLNEEKSELDAELRRIEGEIAQQEVACQHTVEVVQRCEEALKSAMLVDPINQLRQRLRPGEPCSVCGATHHPHAHDMEPEDDEMLRNAEDALEHAKTELQITQNQMQVLNTKQIEIQRDKRNTVQQIKDCSVEMETLQTEMEHRLVEWQRIYPDVGTSSDWTVKQIEEADTAIAALGDAAQAYTEASHAYDMVTQQLKVCKTDIAHEEKSLGNIEEQLQEVNDTIADLQADIASTEEHFWEFLPETFHGVVSDVAVGQFGKKITEVDVHQEKLDTAKTNLKLLNAEIQTDQNSLENLRQNFDDLQVEIDGYQDEGKRLLDGVREKADGLETEDEIDTAIKALEIKLDAKELERDDAQQQLQSSRDLLTKKQAAYEFCKDQYEKSTEKLETERKTYFDKLKENGFDSPEVHAHAFRNETQMQELADQIDAHEDEKQKLTLRITELRTRFEENPFDSETLTRIETEAEETAGHLQEAQWKVIKQQQAIKDLENTLKKREELESKVQNVAEELGRWQRLKDMIGENKLFNFASTIILEQVNRLANRQLESLSSGRYQLKAEGVDDKLKLAVIDRWNADEERPVETLSGGESFLTSLALALALADLSRGRAELNSLFLDEGFGTLDAETLDTAITALEGLHLYGRSIFLISHIQELTRRLPVKINVKKHGDDGLDSSYSSSIQIRG